MKKVLPLVIVLTSIWVIMLIPFQILGHGFMPPDDAMRHCAKVISGKDWGQILVLRDEIKMDSYPGWHAILGFVHRLTGWDQHSLVLFSVTSLAILFCLIPVFFLKFPESWLLSLFTISILEPGWMIRIVLGRPFIFTMASLLIILFIWPRLKDKERLGINIAVLVGITALSVWIHASWYFFILLVAAFILAREYRAAGLIAVSSLAGIFIGASLTGHPVVFIKQMVTHFFLVSGSYDVERQLVGELRPAIGNYGIILTAAAMLGAQALRGKRIRDSVDNPVFILAALSFILGFLTIRVWLDWGMVAFAVWLALEFDKFLKDKLDPFSWQRLRLAVIAAIILFLSVTVDVGSRWSLTRPMDYVSKEDLTQAEFLPGSGGIVYSDSMLIFYQLFYRNPKADWRYMLGFESAFMLPGDLKILREIQKNFSRSRDFEPWVKKMRPEDRLIVRGSPDSQPKIEGLEWHYLALNMWSGRKPRDAKR
ncbi:MAG: hypothetical protein WC522_05890 [Candidatus Omnitrophota bacterium]